MSSKHYFHDFCFADPIKKRTVDMRSIVTHTDLFKYTGAMGLKRTAIAAKTTVHEVDFDS
jgi:hypothetical protein